MFKIVCKVSLFQYPGSCFLRGTFSNDPVPTIVGFSYYGYTAVVNNDNNTKKCCQYGDFSESLNAIWKAFLRFLGSVDKTNIQTVQLYTAIESVYFPHNLN